jgi:translation elongation factor EF-G
MAKQRQIFVYDDVEDADIEAWLEDQDNKSEAIREAIRCKVAGDNGTDDRLTKTAMRRMLREELARVSVAAQEPQELQSVEGPQTRDTDPEAGAALDAMF